MAGSRRQDRDASADTPDSPDTKGNQDIGGNVQAYHLFALADFRLPAAKSRILLGFVGLNFFFIFADVALAHSIGGYFPVFEWIPVIYTAPAAAITFYLALARRWSGLAQALFIVTMTVGVAVGIMGSAFHYLGATFLGGGPLLNLLIFGSPVAAPLTISGAALAGLVSVLLGDEEEVESAYRDATEAPAAFRLHTRTRYLLWLLAVGFLVITLVVLLDHARGGFINVVEWIPIIAGVFGFWVAAIMAGTPEPNEVEAGVFTWAMLGNIGVGVLGFGFHLSAVLAPTGELTLDALLQRAPVMAPLLFSNLGVFGLITVIEPGRIARRRRAVRLEKRDGERPDSPEHPKRPEGPEGQDRPAGPDIGEAGWHEGVGKDLEEETGEELVEKSGARPRENSGQESTPRESLEERRFEKYRLDGETAAKADPRRK